jgi:hypothetical protein
LLRIIQAAVLRMSAGPLKKNGERSVRPRVPKTSEGAPRNSECTLTERYTILDCMLRQLRLENFRCFKDHTITFNPLTVIVGRNNAGKSTVVEAIELLALILNRKATAFVNAPTWAERPRFRLGISKDISDLNFNRDTLFYRYGEGPATITARFSEGVTVRLYVGSEDKIFATFETKETWIRTQNQFKALNLPWIYALPQIAPLNPEEKLLNDLYVESNLYSSLSSRHFRNQVFRAPDAFNTFKSLSEATWAGLRVEPPERAYGTTKAIG